MIEMTCKNCGGELEVSPTDFMAIGPIVLQTCNEYRCKYCQTLFHRSEQFSLKVETVEHVETMNAENVGVVHSARTVVNTGGGAYIGGTLKLAPGTDFVGRDKVTVHR